MFLDPDYNYLPTLKKMYVDIFLFTSESSSSQTSEMMQVLCINLSI